MQEQLGRKAKEFIIGMGDKKSRGKGSSRSIDSDDESDLGSKGKTSKTKKYEKSCTSGKSKKSKGVC